MTDLLLVEKVARAIRQARFERSGLGQVFDFEVPLHETELLDARAAIATMPGYEAGLVEGARAQWEPIETAPEIGTIALLYVPGDHEPYPDISAERDAAMQLEVAVFSEWGWQEPGTGHTDYDEDWRPQPTHWMPLPPPPSIADDGKEGAG